MNRLLLIVVTLINYLCKTESVRILGVFPAPTYSHYALGNSLLTELAIRGHEVTMISPFIHKPPMKNFKDVLLTGFIEEYEEQRKHFFERVIGANFILSEVFINVLLADATDQLLSRDAVQELLKSNQKFDIVIVEEFMSHSLQGLCYHFNAPCVLFSSVGLSRWINSQVGNPLTPSYIPDLSVPYGSAMNFFQRFDNSWRYIFTKLFRHLYVLPAHNRILKKHFPNAPEMSELYYNVSLALINSHISMTPAVPYVPNLIDIGGLHVKPPKDLPKDLQVYLDNAKEGVIFFSLGSNVRSVDMPLEKRETILKSFAKLKQKVLWKWEEEDLPGKPPNVKISKWLPQSDILAHSNVKLFITHGGLLSTTEAVYHGVPIVGIPLFGDQMLNLANAINNGFAQGVPYSDLTKEKLISAIEEILTNPKYHENAKKRSKIMHDQPMKPIDRAVFWIEYVVRHKGAPHLRTAALDLEWYQFLLLDVVLFVFMILFGVSFILYLIVKKCICKKHPQKVVKGKKTN